MLEFVDVSFGYVQSTPVLSEVNLEVRTGEFLALLGQSGSGKSTLIKLAGGLERPNTGEVRLRARVVTALRPQDRQIGYVPQSLALFPNLTVLDNVVFRLTSQRVPKLQRRRLGLALLERVGIAALQNARVHEISGGQAQRVALARALAGDVSVLLLDEPFSNLDPIAADSARELTIDVHRQLGTTTILVTHDAQQALAGADRVAVVGEGRILQSGTPYQVYTNPSSPRVADLTGPANWIAANVHGLGDVVEVLSPIGTLRCEWRSVARPAELQPCVVLVRPEWLELRNTEIGGWRVKRVEWYGRGATASIHRNDLTLHVALNGRDTFVREGAFVEVVLRNGQSLSAYTV